ncbi:MAG: hypothetical protein ACRDRL_01200, partial [Sciscionella sp.]
MAAPIAHRRRSATWSRSAIALIRRLFTNGTSHAGRALERQEAAFCRALWTGAAAKVGIPVHELPGDELEIVTKAGPVRIHRLHCLIDDMQVRQATQDKPLVSRYLAAAGIPVPPSQLFTL